MNRPPTITLVTLILVLASPLNAQQTASSRPEPTERVESFVKSSFDHGVPYSEARALGIASLPTLRQWLREDERRPHWGTIVSTIGYLGEPNDFSVLRDFVMTRFTGEVDEPTFRSILTSMYAIGHIAARSKEATEFLKAGTNPSFYRELEWSYRSHKDAGLGVLLSKLAINGLSLSGRPEAEQTLRGLEKDPYDDTQLSNIREGLKRLREIKVRGRDGYLEALERGDVNF